MQKDMPQFMRTIELSTVKAPFISTKNNAVRRVPIFFIILIKRVYLATICREFTNDYSVSFQQRNHIRNRGIPQFPILTHIHSKPFNCHSFTIIEWWEVEIFELNLFR